MTREIYTCDFLGVSREILAMQFVFTKYGKVSIIIAIMEKSETGNVLNYFGPFCFVLSIYIPVGFNFLLRLSKPGCLRAITKYTRANV